HVAEESRAELPIQLGKTLSGIVAFVPPILRSIELRHRKALRDHRELHRIRRTGPDSVDGDVAVLQAPALSLRDRRWPRSGVLGDGDIAAPPRGNAHRKLIDAAVAMHRDYHATSIRNVAVNIHRWRSAIEEKIHPPHRLAARHRDLDRVFPHVVKAAHQPKTIIVIPERVERNRSHMGRVREKRAYCT